MVESTREVALRFWGCSRSMAEHNYHTTQYNEVTGVLKVNSRTQYHTTKYNGVGQDTKLSVICVRQGIEQIAAAQTLRLLEALD